MVTPRLRATSGSSPMITNSVVPMPKDAAASARMGSEIRMGFLLGYCAATCAGMPRAGRFGERAPVAAALQHAASWSGKVHRRVLCTAIGAYQRLAYGSTGGSGRARPGQPRVQALVKKS